MEIKIGIGYDIHKLVSNKPLIIGNVKIPYKKGFLAHSDGDVLIHSIIDALLGAANLGDIGSHFPDNNPEYKNIDSAILLKKTKELISDKNYTINNIDTTIVCENPKLNTYINKIKTRLSEILNIDIDKISIKIKTKEKMDSVGKGKAIEAYAICLLELKNNKK
jgi:2-C-methyl-D-erythritol 2,4-cyclodiphosphate synthase